MRAVSPQETKWNSEKFLEKKKKEKNEKNCYFLSV